MTATPSLAVVRSIIAQHSPKTLELLDDLKTKFGARLVALTIPKANLNIGNQQRYSAQAIERDFCPYTRIDERVETDAEWKEIKARARKKPSRGKPRARAR